jgi:hypothetical protein
VPGARVERACPAFQTGALTATASLANLVEEEGIEPSFAGCRPAVLPLNDSPKELVAGWRVERHSHRLTRHRFSCPQTKLVREAGVEPAASRLSVECSNHAELFPVRAMHAKSGAPCQIRTGFPGLQVRRIADYAYRARETGANGANRTLIGCLPCNCSPVELHRLGARGGIRNPDLRVTSAALFHLSYSGTSKHWSECGESNSVCRTGGPMPSQ